MLKKTFKYRLYPTKKQTRVLEAILEECRWLYNHFVEERKTAYAEQQASLTYHKQATQLPTLKQSRSSLTTVYSQVLQNVAVRVDLAFQAFFRRVKAGETPGYPRFRGKDRYDSFTYPQSGFTLDEEGKLYCSGVGHLTIRLQRPIGGTIKTLTIRRSATGKWYACFSCEEVMPQRAPVATASVGLDVGLHSFTTASTGEKVDNPRFFRNEEHAVAKAQRKLSKIAKGTPERVKQKKVVARVHERIACKRQNFAHQLSRALVNRFRVIAVEDLEINRLIHHHCLAKSISDAAWSSFFGCVLYKAAEAGRVLIRVNPAYTSQDCSRCGHRQKMPLSERIFRCPCCGLERDRDLNAALNILRVGLHSLGLPLEAHVLQAWE